MLAYFHAILDGTSIVNILLPKFSEQLLGNNANISEEKISSIHQLSDYLDGYYNINKDNKLAYWHNFMANFLFEDISQVGSRVGGHDQRLAPMRRVVQG